ncbi:hypothetical protein EW026_g4307 [Hermanssonia centrifuga]|uniref:DUF6533 domain-containing protein n=1 Tax=Hermanssonia centrifuga TaxID=98765 RepID=A0A4S4KHK0_9APHY|nr:hypothetical protein EW026_g4307 [Hermanssonia centrifuga]
MSQALSDSSLVAALQAEVNANYLIFGTTALTAYEYVITIKQEVNMVWRRKWILTTWIFMANRYLLIGNMLLAVIPTTSKLS